MHLLILGGTADARIVAENLHQRGVEITYSVAGLVRRPALSCRIISGGFTQFGGLEAFIHQFGISAVLDATHPYAKIMSDRAVEATRNTVIPCWRYHRQAWQAKEGDNWQEVASWQCLLPKLFSKQSIFLTAGQVPLSVLEYLTAGDQQSAQSPTLYLRTAVAPKYNLPRPVRWQKAIGPFLFEDEKSFMQRHQIDALVTKNSGGNSMYAKLKAARALDVPVYMFKRPQLPAADQLFFSHDTCIRFVANFFQGKKNIL